MLWFDVEKNGYTTIVWPKQWTMELWFDVEKNGYTTVPNVVNRSNKLWFDVEKNGYTTLFHRSYPFLCCGLM